MTRACRSAASQDCERERVEQPLQPAARSAALLAAHHGSTNGSAIFGVGSNIPGNQNIGDAASFEFVHHLERKLGAVGLFDPQPEHLLLAFGRHVTRADRYGRGRQVSSHSWHSLSPLDLRSRQNLVQPIVILLQSSPPHRKPSIGSIPAGASRQGRFAVRI